MLVVLAVGLILRFRTAWALTIGALVLLAGAEFLYVNTWQVAVAAVVLVVWLFWKRSAFDRPVVLKGDAARIAREFGDNVARFRRWRAERRARRDASSGAPIAGSDDLDELAGARAGAPAGPGSRLRTAAPAGHRARGTRAAEPPRKTSWEQQAEKGALLMRQVGQEGILADEPSAKEEQRPW